VAAVLCAIGLAAQAPAPSVDTSKIGPQVGTAAPAFSGPDQNGVTRSLAELGGRAGTMLVFNRSADW
jgi:hypothetical protein